MSIEAMKQGLEALEESIDLVRNEYESDWRHGIPTRQNQLQAMKQLVDKHETAIAALKAAIEEAEKQEPSVEESIQQLVEALAYSKGWMHDYADAIIRDAIDRKQPEQEPVAWLRKNGFRFNAESEPQDDSELPLYTPPPKREWQGLTDEEIADAYGDYHYPYFVPDFARAIESKLKEKNT